MRSGAIVILALAAAAPLLAQVDAKTADIDEAFRLADVRLTLESLSSHVTRMTGDVIAVLPRDQRQLFEPLIKEVSRELKDPNGLYRDIRTYFAKYVNAGKLATFLALERTPTYRTMHRLEAAAETPAGEALRRRFEANLKEDPPEPKRIEMMRRLDSAANTTGTQISLVLGAMNAMLATLGAQAPAGVDTKNADFMGKIQTLVGDRVLAQYLYVYRNADDADLEDYAAAAQQPAVEWFNHSLQLALVGAATERETHLSDDMKTRDQKAK